jgi:hypothetical protein
MSSFVVGSLYIPNYQGIAWSQPGGVGTTVYPQQNTGSFGYPENQILMQEPGQGLWVSPCGHWLDTWQVFRDYDTAAQSSAAIQTCPMCSYINRVYEPYEEIFDTVRFPILV